MTSANFGNSMPWDEASEKLLRELWGVIPAGDIGLALQRSKNAVLGKANRMGLSNPRVILTEEERTAKKQAKAIRDAEARRRSRQMAGRISRPLAVNVAKHHRNAPSEVDMQDAVRFVDLRPFSKFVVNQCRYIPAETPAPDYFACAATTAPGESYCAHCKTIVFARSGQLNITEAERAARAAKFRKAILVSTVPLTARIPDDASYEEVAA